jgi:hypothetical protein
LVQFFLGVINVTNRYFIGGLTLGIFVALIVMLLFTITFLSFHHPGCGVTSILEVTKNVGCIEYMHQNPACSDWTRINVSWQGNVTAFNKFMNIYGCNNETCARITCACPGY